MPLDYSKWDNIEISDDEDDTHPNVDTPSLFKVCCPKPDRLDPDILNHNFQSPTVYRTKRF